jgi:gag-polyprotein putative aspartyl protease
MPFLTFPIGAEGALVDIFVALSTPRVDTLKAAGISFPPPEKAKALIDTGASISSISPRIAKGLGLIPSGITPIYSATTGVASQNCNLYDVCLAFVQPSIKVLGVNIPVIEVDLFTPGVDVLLGRDMLRQCLCIYDGQSRTFILAF